MNIRTGIENVNQIASTPSGSTASLSKNSTRSSEALAADTAQVSSAATQVAQSASIPDVRLDKVAAIRNQIESGSYSVPPSDVATKVIDSILTRS
jgi:flagellar biosynthesis anti-sigma factor FlgM